MDPAFKLNTGNFKVVGWGSALTDWALVEGVSLLF